MSKCIAWSPTFSAKPISCRRTPRSMRRVSRASRCPIAMASCPTRGRRSSSTAELHHHYCKKLIFVQTGVAPLRPPCNEVDFDPRPLSEPGHADASARRSFVCRKIGRVDFVHGLEFSHIYQESAGRDDVLEAEPDLRKHQLQI